MYKTVSFNVYDLNLEDVVYKDRNSETSARDGSREEVKTRAKDEQPIPKSFDEFWKKPFDYNKNW